VRSQKDLNLYVYICRFNEFYFVILGFQKIT